MQPLDIKTQKFKKGLVGYKASDVDEFLETVYRAYDELYKEHSDMSERIEKLNISLETNRLKIYELETQLQNSGSSKSKESAKESTSKDKISTIKTDSIKTEEKEDVSKAEAVKSDTAKESASSRFFKKDDAPVTSSMDDDDDEIFVGEIEDARKPDRMMIGDGEEEDADFEFL